jgi:hypothetical protein
VILGFSRLGIALLSGIGSASTARFTVRSTPILNNATGFLIKPADNGFNAVSGLGNVTVDILRVVVESNGSVGIQGN